MLELFQIVHDQRAPDRRSYINLDRMLVAMGAAEASADGRPPNASQLAERLHMPRSNVSRHLKTLAQTGEFKVIKTIHATYYKTSM